MLRAARPLARAARHARTYSASTSATASSASAAKARPVTEPAGQGKELAFAVGAALSLVGGTVAVIEMRDRNVHLADVQAFVAEEAEEVKEEVKKVVEKVEEKVETAVAKTVEAAHKIEEKVEDEFHALVAAAEAALAKYKK